MQNDAKLIDSYLLGDLSGKDCTAVEDRLFLDHNFFETIQFHEDELIDDYIHGNLSAREKTLFETNFLASPRRKERLKTALALDAYIAQQVPPQARSNWLTRFRITQKGAFLPRLAFAACMLAIILAGLVVSIKLHRQRESAEAVRQLSAPPQETGDSHERANLPATETNARTPALPGARIGQSADVASLVLPPGLVRGNEEHILEIRKDVRVVRLLLEATYELPAGDYAVVIHNVSNVHVWTKNLQLTRTQRPPLQLDIPVEVLPLGTYTVSLSKTGSDAVSYPPIEYAFVVKQAGK
jgi:hypothetical protein